MEDNNIRYHFDKDCYFILEKGELDPNIDKMLSVYDWEGIADYIEENKEKFSGMKVYDDLLCRANIYMAEAVLTILWDKGGRSPMNILEIDACNAYLDEAEMLNPSDEVLVNYIHELRAHVAKSKKRKFTGTASVIIGTGVVAGILLFGQQPAGPILLILLALYIVSSFTPQFILDRYRVRGKKDIGRIARGIGGFFKGLMDAFASPSVIYVDKYGKKVGDDSSPFLALVMIVLMTTINIVLLPLKILINFSRNYILCSRFFEEVSLKTQKKVGMSLNAIVTIANVVIVLVGVGIYMIAPKPTNATTTETPIVKNDYENNDRRGNPSTKTENTRRDSSSVASSKDTKTKTKLSKTEDNKKVSASVSENKKDDKVSQNTSKTESTSDKETRSNSVDGSTAETTSKTETPSDDTNKTDDKVAEEKPADTTTSKTETATAKKPETKVVKEKPKPKSSGLKYIEKVDGRDTVKIEVIEEAYKAGAESLKSRDYKTAQMYLKEIQNIKYDGLQVGYFSIVNNKYWNKFFYYGMKAHWLDAIAYANQSKYETALKSIDKAYSSMNKMDARARQNLGGSLSQLRDSINSMKNSGKEAYFDFSIDDQF